MAGINKYAVERAIIANRTNEPFVLVERVDGDEISDLSDLDWQADTEPPTWADVKDWTTGWLLSDGQAQLAAEIRAQLAASDVWAIRHVEDGISLTPARIAYRKQLRTLLDEAATNTDPASVALPDPPPPPKT